METKLDISHYQMKFRIQAIERYVITEQTHTFPSFFVVCVINNHCLERCHVVCSIVLNVIAITKVYTNV